MKKTIIYISVLTILIITFKTNSHAWPIPHSGVTKCYDNEKEIPCPKPGEPFYGQSGNYIINPKSYTKLDEKGKDLPDDAEEWLMVRDNVTGLIWEVKLAKDGSQDYSNPHDSDNTYTWYDSNPETNHGYTGTYNDGKNIEMCIKQMNESQFGSFGYWRVPLIKELASLSALEKLFPAINKLYFRETYYDDWMPAPGYGRYGYWSCTSTPFEANGVWGFNYNYAKDCNYYKHRVSSIFFPSIYVLAVRGEQCRSFDHLIITDDKTVTDTKTGLIWATATYTSKAAMNWEYALNYCETNFLAGYSDWRLPEREELRSIVNYETWRPASVTNIMSEFYWSSTTHAGNTDYAWGVAFHVGYGDRRHKDSSHYVRAVRGGQCRLSGHLVIWLPMQADILITGKTIAISWDTANIEGKVKITLSRHGGKDDTFETISQETENDGHYDWTITGPPSPKCMLKIEPISLPYSGTQQSFFTIKNPDMIINTNVQSNFTILGPESLTCTGHSYTIDNALPGTYTITYAPDVCWQTPAKESQSLTYWGTLTFDGVYGEIPADPIQNLRADL